MSHVSERIKEYLSKNPEFLSKESNLLGMALNEIERLTKIVNVLKQKVEKMEDEFDVQIHSTGYGG